MCTLYILAYLCEWNHFYVSKPVSFSTPRPSYSLNQEIRWGSSHECGFCVHKASLNRETNASGVPVPCILRYCHEIEIPDDWEKQEESQVKNMHRLLSVFRSNGF